MFFLNLSYSRCHGHTLQTVIITSVTNNADFTPSSRLHNPYTIRHGGGVVSWMWHDVISFVLQVGVSGKHLTARNCRLLWSLTSRLNKHMHSTTPKFMEQIIRAMLSLHSMHCFLRHNAAYINKHESLVQYTNTMTSACKWVMNNGSGWVK